MDRDLFENALESRSLGSCGCRWRTTRYPSVELARNQNIAGQPQCISNSLDSIVCMHARVCVCVHEQVLVGMCKFECACVCVCVCVGVCVGVRFSFSFAQKHDATLISHSSRLPPQAQLCLKSVALCVCVCVCVYLYLPHTEDQNEFLTNKVRSFLGSEDILAGPHFVFTEITS